MATLNHLAPSGRFLLATIYAGLWFALGASIGRLGRRT